MDEHLDVVGGRAVRALVAGPARPAGPDVVIVPGLGALGYLTRLTRAVAALGARCTLLDLPGFGSRRPLAAEPTVAGVAATTLRWLDERPSGRPVILVGHSTGAQAAARAARQTTRELAGLVLAGPTFAPGQRRTVAALAQTAAALRRESPAELRILRDYLRGGRQVVTLFRSAVEDRLEDAVADVTVPLLLTAGVADSLAPYWWLCTLAEAARTSTAAQVTRLPGSHNNPFTHPAALAGLMVKFPDEGRSPQLRGPLQRQPARPV